MISRKLTLAESDAFGAELDALRAEVTADLGQRDLEHIRRMLRVVRYTEVAGRVRLQLGIGPLSFVVGASALGASKILENMEVGHNVMHGQYDWTGDPALDSRRYEWDTVCTAEDWRHSHNFVHHTYTNIVGRDRDLGYSILRVNSAQRWQPLHLVQPVAAAVLALLFQWGVGLHDLQIVETVAGKQSLAELKRRARPFLRKAAWQLGKDYAVYPLLALANAPRVVAGNAIANAMRNLWTFSVIFCGHFPEGVATFTPSAAARENRGQWYVRQLNGSANIEGSRVFHILTGHLSHQIEHHLFPDIPAIRYPELAPRVREICERYGQAYNTGRFAKQLASVVRQIVVNAVPDRAARTRLFKS